MNGLMIWRRLRTHFDWVLVLSTLAIAVLGLVNLYSAARHAPRHGLFQTQVGWMVLGAVLFVVTALIDYRVWLRLSPFILILGAVLVIGVHFAGVVVKGSRRWIGVGPFSIQPSEFMKLAVIMRISRLIHDWNKEEMTITGIAWAFIFLGLSIVVIALQPDLGTAVLVTLICVSILLLAARNVWLVIGGIGAVGAAVPFLWMFVFRPYQKKRILTFMDPSSDPTGAGYHARQSIMAIGSGRLTGKGFLHGTQNQFNFLPEHWTDFPFSVWAEEWGFFGSFLLLGLYLFLILWIINIASQARDRFGATLCVGVAAMFFWHIVVNIGMVTGLAPVVGVTLPLVSYGGSSVLTMFIGLGLVGSVSLRRFAN